MLDLSVDSLLDLPERVKIAVKGLLALPHEFLLPATIAEQTRARNSVDTWLNTLPSPPATSGLHILADTALAPLNIPLSIPGSIQPEVKCPSPSSDGTLLDTDNVTAEQQ